MLKHSACVTWQSPEATPGFGKVSARQCRGNKGREKRKIAGGHV